MAASDTPADFCDQLAGDYHLVFEDWSASITRQAGVISGLLRDHGLTSGAVLDASCGIGTQAIGLAQAGFVVTATDISPVSVQRCAAEAATRGLDIKTELADIRVLDIGGVGHFDAVLSFDNALTHLLDDVDLHAACTALRRALRPGGTLLASIRDYDTVLRDRPSGDPPRRFITGCGERIIFQIWEWESDESYRMRHFIMQGDASGWVVLERRTTCRALSRAALSDVLCDAGFKDVEWYMPDKTRYYQPVVSARRPT